MTQLTVVQTTIAKILRFFLPVSVCPHYASLYETEGKLLLLLSLLLLLLLLLLSLLLFFLLAVIVVVMCSLTYASTTTVVYDPDMLDLPFECRGLTLIVNVQAGTPIQHIFR